MPTEKAKPISDEKLVAALVDFLREEDASDEPRLSLSPGQARTIERETGLRAPAR
jgi:hypothetical protein